MEKTYDALIERLKKSYKWEMEGARALERQPDLTEGEMLEVEKRRAIAKKLAVIISVETGEEVKE